MDKQIPLILSLGAILGAAISTFLTNSYLDFMVTELVDLLGLTGPAAPFIPLGFIGLLGAGLGAKLAALAWVYQAQQKDLAFLWNFILSAATIVGAGLGLLLAATIPAVFDFAQMAVHDAFPQVLPWIFIAGFGFVVSVGLAFFAYRGCLTLRRDLK